MEIKKLLENKEKWWQEIKSLEQEYKKVSTEIEELQNKRSDISFEVQKRLDKIQKEAEKYDQYCFDNKTGEFGEE